MLKTICCAIGTLFVAQTGLAITTQFEDLPANGVFASGTLFSSGGLNFKVVPFPATGISMGVDSFGKASGSGQELSFSRSVGVEFQLPSVASEIDFLFGDYFSDSTGEYVGGQLIVNGFTSGRGMPPLDDTTLGGVHIAVKPVNVTGGVTGRLTLTGPIQSLTVGSTSFYIDDLTVTVPEPTSAMLILVGGMIGTLLWRRRLAR